MVVVLDVTLEMVLLQAPADLVSQNATTKLVRTFGPLKLTLMSGHIISIFNCRLCQAALQSVSDGDILDCVIKCVGVQIICSPEHLKITRMRGSS